MTIPPIKFVKPLKTDTWKLAEIKLLVDCKECVTCGTELKPVVSLVGTNRIDVGVCPDCGLCTYMQKLPKESIDGYYDKVWMGDSQEEAMKKARDRRETIEKDENKVERLNKIFKNHGLDTTKPFLDIGCGYGERMFLVQRAGFKDVYGVETSGVRAEAVRQVHGFPAFEGNFEEYTPKAKFGLIICYHVLEHTYNPDEILNKCAEIQDIGGVINFDLPNFLGEPSMGVVFFLPHLYSFRCYSLKKLFAKHGYEVFEEDVDAGNISLWARKVENPELKELRPDNDFYETAKKKLMLGLGLITVPEQVLEWQSHTEGSLLMPKYYWERRNKKPINRSVEVLYLEKEDRKTDSPIEFQFEGNVKLFYK